MKTNKTAGVALILGAVGSIVTMAFHPRGGGLDTILRQASLNIGVHTLAVASLTVMIFGFLRLSRTQGPQQPQADLGFVAFVIGAGAAILAAIHNGFVTPILARQASDTDPAEMAAWNVVFDFNHHVGEVMTKVFIVATSTAIFLWSMGMVRIGTGWRSLGAAGIGIGAAGLIALFTGHIRDNVHDVGLFILCIAAWIAVLGVLLCRSGGTTVPN